ncbi:hypothetical protein Tco_0632147, partial [Tanacetum coccineum]
DQERCKGGVPDNGASGLVWECMMGGGNGSEWKVDAALEPDHRSLIA